MRIVTDEKKCVGCHACYIACIASHHEPEEEKAKGYRAARTLVNCAEGFQKTVYEGCTHCGLCMKQCPQGAIYREEMYGLILVDQNRCVGCRACAEVCPRQVIRFGTDGKMEKCDGCIDRIRVGKQPACVRVCSTGAMQVV